MTPQNQIRFREKISTSTLLNASSIADVLFLVEERSWLFSIVDHLEQPLLCAFESDKLTVYTGYARGRKVSVLHTALDAYPMDGLLQELNHLLYSQQDFSAPANGSQPLHIIKLSTATALSDGIVPGSWIVSEFSVGMDNLLYYYRFENNPEEIFLLNAFLREMNIQHKAIHPYITSASKKMLNAFGSSYVQGMTLSSPGHFALSPNRLQLPPAFPGLIEAVSRFSSGTHRILATETGTAAFYGLGKLLHCPCLALHLITPNDAKWLPAPDLGPIAGDLLRAVEDLH